MKIAKNSNRIRGTTREVEQAARHLRQNLTPAEAILWEALRGRKLEELKFRCQHPIGRFIVDFYCPSLKLIIEIDGGIHIQQQDYDQARTDQLQDFGYSVLRFTNNEVINDLPKVLNQIIEAVQIQFPPELGG
jgi:very-short-patch-repair endonuclease